MAAKPKLSIRSFTTRLDASSSPETKITRLPWPLIGPSLKWAIRMELNTLTMRAPGAKPATISLAPVPPRVGKNKIGAGFDERIGGVDEDTTVPRGEAPQGRIDVLPRHGEQYVVETGRFLNGRRRGAPAEF